MELQETLRNVELFKGLTKEELDSIAEICREKEYKAGELIFAEGSKGEEMYAVKEGRVRIELGLGSNGSFATVHRIGGGQNFGELALIDGGRRTASARCETDSRVVVLDRKRLYGLFKENEHLGYTVMKNTVVVLCSRLRKADLQLASSILWKG